MLVMNRDKEITGNLRNRLVRIRDACLGLREDRTPNLPTKTSDGRYSGGVAIERNSHATRVRGARCYTFGVSHQKTPNLASPAADGKVYDGKLDQDMQLRRDFTQVHYD